MDYLKSIMWTILIILVGCTMKPSTTHKRYMTREELQRHIEYDEKFLNAASIRIDENYKKALEDSKNVIRIYEELEGIYRSLRKKRAVGRQYSLDGGVGEGASVCINLKNQKEKQ